MNVRYFLAAPVAALLLMPASSPAKDPPRQSPLIGRLEACRTITDAAQRLACFGGASEALIAATKTGDVAVVDKSEVRRARKSLFGFGMPRIPFFSGDDTADVATESLESTVKSATGIGYGKFRIVITEGNAVWETTESFATLRDPQVGQKIVIKRGPLGSYMIKVNNQRAVKGKRVG